VHVAGVVAALAGDDDVALFQGGNVFGVLERGFVFGHGRRLAACVRGGKKHRLDQIEVFFLCHAVHQDRADHAAPADQTYQLAHVFALSKKQVHA
jgi:hypothetical protein